MKGTPFGKVASSTLQSKEELFFAGRGIYGGQVSAATSNLKLLTAPLVGALLGAIEEGTVFFVLTITDEHLHDWLLSADLWVQLAVVIGMIFGGVLGGIIGLVVALRNAQRREGFWLGIGIGLIGAVFVVFRTFPSDEWGIVALSFVPAGASIGFLSAIVTSRRSKPQQTATARPSHRIFD